MTDKLNTEKITDLLVSFLSWWSLAFFLSPFKYIPWGPAYRYLTYVGAPIALLVLVNKLRNKAYFKIFLKKIIKFIIPFIPFFISYFTVYLYHVNTGFNPYIKLNAICLIIIINAVLFGVLVQSKKIVSPKIFFLTGSFSVLLFFGDCVYTAITNSTDLFSIRSFVIPYATIYGHCIALISGLCFIGAFYPVGFSIKLRLFFLLSSIFGFFAAIGMLTVRATILVPCIAVFAIFCIVKPKHKIYKILIPCISILFLMSLFFISPMQEKIVRGVEEVRSTMLVTDVSSTIAKINSQQTLTGEEERLKTSLNTSMGGRVAVWVIAKDLTKGKEVFGTGNGQPADFVDVKKLFSYSKDYLPHFHSDYIQVFVIGGLVLTLGFILTQFLLLYESLFSPLKMYLTLSTISFGIIDMGFCDIRGFTCFMGAWLIVSLWEKDKHRVNPLTR